MKLTRNQPVLLLCILAIACQKTPKKSIDNSESLPSQSGIHFLISSDGDSIPTGQSIPAKGQRIDPNSVSKPKKRSLRGRPKIVTAHPNVYPAGAARAIPITKELTIMTPGEAGIPLPHSSPAGGRKTPCIHTEPIPAIAPRMKDGATSHLQYLDVDQGMVSSYVWTLLEDSKGNLWFGTNDGISRYDGNSFTHYTTAEGLNNNRERSMLEDSKGNLWFGTDGGGVSRYDGISFTHYSMEDGLSDDHVWCMLEDNQGKIWFGTQGGGVNCYDGASFTHYTTKEGLSHNTIWSMLQDSQGNLWFGTQGGGVSRYDGTSFTHFTMEEGLGNNRVWCMLEDSQGNLWFGTQGGGVSRYDGISFTNYTTGEGLSDNTIWSMLQDKRGNLWFGTEGGGVNRYDGTSFVHYTIDEGLSDNRVWCMLEDNQGYLWFGTRGGGMNRYDGDSFIHYNTEVGLSSNAIWSMLEDRQGNLWFGTRDGGVSWYDGSSFTHYTTREGLSSNTITSILEGRQGDLWFGTESGGVSRYDGISFSHYTVEEGLGNNNVQSMLEDSHGNFWFGTAGGGLSHYDGTAFTHYGTNEGLYFTVRCMLEDSQGNLWFGSQGGGVSRFDGSSFTHYTTAEGLSNNLVWCMLEDNQGNVWFGTQGGGVDRYDGKTFTHYTTKEGLSHNWIWSILEDENNNIWLSTEKGLTVLVPVPVGSSTVNDTTPTDYQFFTFGKPDGLKRLDFSQTACLDRRNRIWWGSSDGLAMLDLNEFELPGEIPHIRLNTIEIAQTFVDYRNLGDATYRQSLAFGESLLEASGSIAPFHNYPATMTLPHHLNHLTFRFSALEWSAPHKLHYSYLMEGLDEGWSPLSAENKADYRNLPPGNYTFMIKAIGAAKKWSEPFNYSFSIYPPWWLTWWAKILYVITALLVFISLFYQRMSSLKLRQLELEQTVADRTAEVVAQTAEAVAQRNRSEELLLNILPAEVAEELKETGHTQPVRFEEVSILFADFYEFTNIVASIPGKKLVEELDVIFQHFDDVMDTEGLEKIQTIGDAYIAAGGLPKEDPTHAIKCVSAGKKMIDYLNERNKSSAIKWQLRVGIHSGPITAGVVGKKKFTYDVFGDTVNIAARIESASTVGKINVSAYTYDLIRDHFPCEYRGKINAKGKGDLDMYFVN